MYVGYMLVVNIPRSGQVGLFCECFIFSTNSITSDAPNSSVINVILNIERTA